MVYVIIAVLGIGFGVLLGIILSGRRIRALEVDLAGLRKEKETHAEKNAWLETAEKQLREAFQALSSEALRSNSDEYLKQVREQLNGMQKIMQVDWGRQKEEMSGLVAPLKENLGKLDEEVRKLEQKREGAYEGLKQNLSQLQNAYTSLRDTTTELSTALTKSSVARGSWGEISLRRIVELAGMTKHVDFDEQAQKDQGRPDMKIYMPNRGVLPVDAKVTLKTYMDVVEAKDEAERKGKLEAHTANVRARISELSSKAYWKQFEDAPEFVVMFLPHDGFLSAAFAGDKKGELLEYAFENKVLLVTPITLIALLKTAVYGWQQQAIATNAREIARQGKELYERILTFATYLKSTGKSLDGAVKSYNAAVGSMDARLIPAARRFKELGVSSTELPDMEPIDRQARLPEGGESEVSSQ